MPRAKEKKEKVERPLKTLDAFPTRAEPQPAKTFVWDWDQLLNGEVWQLEPGEDYDDADAFRAALDAECEARDVPTVRIMVKTDPPCVVVQAEVAGDADSGGDSEDPNKGEEVGEADSPPPAGSVDLSRLTAEELVAELRRRERVPLGVLKDGTWFTWATPGSPEVLACKMSGSLECDVKAVVTRRGGHSCRDEMHVASGTPVYVVPSPDGGVPERAKRRAASSAPADPKAPKAARTARATPAPRTASDKIGRMILGLPLTGVVRWMGANDWTLEQARKVVDAFGGDFPDNRIKLHLAAGKANERGGPATLTAAQVKELNSRK